MIGGILGLAIVALNSPAAEPPTGRELYQKILPSCAWVLAGPEGRGTGWLVDADRKWLVTCFHVVGDSKSVDVVFSIWRDGRLLADRDDYVADLQKWRIAGKVIRQDPGRDMALIELASIPKNIRAIPLAPRSAHPGERIHLFGNRRDLAQLWGYTSAFVRQDYRGDEGYPWRTRKLAQRCRLLALQAPINEGDSGGPAVNDAGELAGVTSSILWQAERVAAAIDVAEVRKFVFPDPPAPANPSPQADRDLYADLVRTLALVKSPSSTSRHSACIIDRSRRLLLTTAEAVGPHERIELLFPKFQNDRVVAEPTAYKDAARIRAGIVVRDARRNLALLEAESLPATAKDLPISPASAQPGDSLHSIGNPNGIDALWLYAALSVRQAGKVQLSDRKEDGAAAVLVLQGPGGANDSGGPIVDGKGRLVAIAGGKDGPEQQANYALDVSEIRGFLDANRPRWDPKTADDFQRRGHRRMRIRQDAGALKDFEKALQLAPNHRDAFIDLTDLHIRRGDFDKAAATIELAIKRLDPKQCATIVSQGAAIQLSRDKLDDALDFCNGAIKIDKKCARAFAMRAEVWRLKKDLAKALADADEAAWLDANLEMAYLHRGLIQMDKSDWDAAASDFTRAIELDPYDPAPLQLRAKVFEMKGDTNKAERDSLAAKQLK